MAKYTKEELSTRINDLELDDDIKISLMEDISDSISTDESEELATLRSEIERKDNELSDLKEKYKARFMAAVETKEPEKDSDEYKETEVIDVKEI